jgi:hypothetical protein
MAFIGASGSNFAGDGSVFEALGTERHQRRRSTRLAPFTHESKYFSHEAFCYSSALFSERKSEECEDSAAAAIPDPNTTSLKDCNLFRA